jgi:dihydrofolate reductase
MCAAAGDTNAWIVGGGDVAGQFFDAGFLDELIVQVGSVTLGRGKPLFPRRVLSPVLRLVSAQQMGPGMVGSCGTGSRSTRRSRSSSMETADHGD